VVSVTTRLRFTPGERTPVPILYEAGWAPEPVWTQRLEEKSFAPARDRSVVYYVGRFATKYFLAVVEAIVQSYVVGTSASVEIFIISNYIPSLYFLYP
jgi:hypothetical protein